VITKTKVLSPSDIVRLYSAFIGREQCAGSFLSWAAWVSIDAPVEVLVHLDEEYPNGSGEFYQRYISTK